MGVLPPKARRVGGRGFKVGLFSSLGVFSERSSEILDTELFSACLQLPSLRPYTAFYGISIQGLGQP